MKIRTVFIFLVALLSLAGASNVATYEGLLQAIRETRAASEARIETAVEQEKVREAWETGKLIDEHILLHKERANYGEQVLKRLSGDLTVSETELGYIVQFFYAYPISPPAGKLSWGHYRELLSLNDAKERDEVIKQATNEHWSRDQTCEEVNRRQHRIKVPAVLPDINPGPLNTYKIIRLKDRLKVDLGFGAYFDLPEKDAKKFKEGDIVTLVGAGLKPAPTSGRSIQNLFTYAAQVTSVVDGDTFHALIDLGFGVTLAQRVRLRRIDAAEIETAEGKEAKALLEKILARDQGRVLLQSRELDQHGRPIADVWVDGKPVDQELLDQGLAVTVRD